MQQFLCAMKSLRSTLPQFQELVAPLHTFLEALYTHIGKCTKRTVSPISLDKLGWNSSLTCSFGACKTAIADRATLGHRDRSKHLCIHTDASDTNWSGLVTQVPYADISLTHNEQADVPLAFHSGRFSSTQLGRSTV